ncbi:nuclear transport factor 2 family protein [Streptomyces sp. JB150]|uniref:ester cyclase n=1 Tax=Streptomyces sp. JB150 TaxID=2714844 RepID=UPI0014087D75|nr:nuclear transport factor 2 family protein [Streptomyces sp. JB150]QIJ65447.1 ester cyclase [Streptomyces sp. JB150]
MHRTHPNAALVRTCLAAVSKGDPDAWLACYTTDAVSEDVPLGSVWRGHTQLDAGVRSWLEAIPDTRMQVHTVSAGDRAGACEWTMTGTLHGALDGLPAELAASAKGKSFTMRGATVYRFSEDGRIAHETLYWDVAGVLTQFGLMGT